MENITNDEQGFIDSLGAMDGATASDTDEGNTPEGTDDATNEGDQTPEGNEGDNTPEGSTNPEDNSETPDDKKDPLDLLTGDKSKQNNAFAEMRVQNKKQRELLSSMSSVLGFDPTKMAPEELEEALSGVITQAQAQQQHIPEEMLTRLNSLEAINQKYMQEHLHSNARNGLVLLRDKYGASQDQLETFIKGLTDDGVNPLEQDVDFETEYIKRNFSNIVESKVQEALQNETARTNKAKEHASTPGNTRGGVTDNESKINSVQELDAAFNSFEK